MQTILAAERGIAPGESVAKPLHALFRELSKTEGEKTLVFAPGTYRIASADCPAETLYITNTIGDNEWKAGETPHLLKVGMLFQNIKNLTVEGNGAVFLVDGQMLHIVLEHCENIVLHNFTIKSENPDLHEWKVRGKGRTFLDFELDAESRYEKDGKRFYLTGTDYKTAFIASRAAHWIGKVSAENPDGVRRVGHPFMLARKVRETAPHKFRVYYWIKPRYAVGDAFYVFDVRRKYAGIFADGCKNLTLKNIAQHFNYSLAFVAQNTENITVDGAYFAPEKGSKRKLASVADFIQICMCKGDIIIKNSHFEGAGDDCLNVHGVHYKVVKAEGNRLTVRYMHPQTHGFNPLEAGDKIEYMDTATLLPKGGGEIIQSELLSEYEILLTVDTAKGCAVGDVVEDVTKCPNLLFENNYINRIITRGLLITTRGKVVVENNVFNDTSMHSILFSDDAKNWYESGRVLDVTVRGNVFRRCPGKNIFIHPENSAHGGAVHKNFLIENNAFSSAPAGGIHIKSAQNIVIRGNKIAGAAKDFLETRDADGITCDF